MSISNIEVIMDRISVAEKHSPLVVFREHNNGGGGQMFVLNCMFAGTVETTRRIENDSNFVGYFNKEMSKDFCRIMLSSALMRN